MDYWTEADQAELEAGIWALVYVLDCIEDKDERYRKIDVLLDWWRYRHARSKADYLRRRHLEKALAEMNLEPSDDFC